MNTSTANPTASRKRAAHPISKAAAPAQPTSVSQTPGQTALAKISPKHNRARKKRRHIVARVNVGWGHAVYLRGDGGSLNWEVGTPLICLTDDQWVWSYAEDRAPREIKFLRNDTDWALGGNHGVIMKKLLVFTPQFPEF